MPKLKRIEDAFLFLTLLFLPTQLGKHFWPDFSYIYSLKIDYLSPTVYFWDILVVALLVVWVLRKPKINKTALNLFLLFLFTQLVSLFGAGRVGVGLVRLEQYLVVGMFGVFLASADYKSILKQIYLPLSLGITGESVLGTYQFIKGSTLGLWIFGERTFTIATPGIAKFDFNGIQFLRPYGTFPHPNVLAGYLLIVAIVLSFWRPQADRISKMLSLRSSMTKIVDVLAGLTVLLTMSRVVILAGIMSLLLTIKRKWFVWVFFIFLVLSPILFIRFSSLANFDNLTLLRREELIGNSWQIFMTHPLFGVGLNNFIPTLAGNLLTGPSRFLQPVHNIFLLALSETGIVGLIGLILLVGVPVLKFLKLYPTFLPKTEREALLIRYTLNSFLLPWFLILFLGMFDHYFLTLPQGIRIFFLVWGLSFSQSTKALHSYPKS